MSELIHDVKLGNELKSLLRMEHVNVSAELREKVNKIDDGDIVWVGISVDKGLHIVNAEIIDQEWFRKNLFIGGYTGEHTCTTK